MAKKFRLNNEFEIDGYIIHISNVISHSPKFTFRLIVIESLAGGYKQEIPINFINERLSVSNGFALNDHVHITFQVRGNSNIKDGKKKWFANLDGLNMSKL